MALKPCAGFDQMIQDLQKIYANWIAKGRETCADAWGNSCDPRASGFFDKVEYKDGEITIKKWYARKQLPFFSCSTIDEDQLKVFCEKNKLSYWKHKYNADKDVLQISGGYYGFSESEIGGLIAQSRERAKSLKDMAQKFYESEMMQEVWKRDDWMRDFQKYVDRTKPCVSNRGFAYKGWTDREGYTIPGGSVYNFKEHQYRNLETEDEIIAFTLALCARNWKTDPRGISWEHLEWYIDIQYPCSDGSMELNNMPRYTGIYLHEPPRVTEVSPPPPLKDFF